MPANFDFNRKKDPMKNLTLDSYCKEYCEPRIDEAKVFLQENNMRHAYLRLAEVLKKDHKHEKHKRMEEMALDIVITSLGGSFHPGIVIFICSLSTKGQFMTDF